MADLIPAILQKSLTEITLQLKQVVGIAPTVQLDVVDGIFTPEYSWPYTPQGSEEFSAICSGSEALPLREEFNFEIDLMVVKSARDAGEWVSAGASRIVIHAESPDASIALNALKASRQSAYPIVVGVALTSTASPRALTPFEGLFDYVQVMGIAEIGRQGEPFDKHALTLIRELKATYPTLPIQIDGGVREDIIKELLGAGATRLVVGSAIFAHGDPRVHLRALKEKI